ncbi:MAG: hypothetical protein HQL63_12070 [Magnetococcales bacterium]|nr:hypothetical protein [Magnetococcales bacterium]
MAGTTPGPCTFNGACDMKVLGIASLGLAIFFQSGILLAAPDQYNPVPADDAQYKNCKIYAMKKWEGGGELSPIDGQSKAEAFCICMWNETPEDFKGHLAKFSETDAGKKLDRLCSKYANWSD